MAATAAVQLPDDTLRIIWQLKWRAERAEAAERVQRAVRQRQHRQKCKLRAQRRMLVYGLYSVNSDPVDAMISAVEAYRIYML